MIPFLLGTLATIGYWWSKRDRWNWTQELPGVILISFLCSPYGARPYDLVLLLLPLVFVVEKLVSKGSKEPIQWFVLCWLVVNIVLVVKLFLGVETLYYVWVAPVLTVMYLAFLQTTKSKT
jgi:hypothetical protein